MAKRKRKKGALGAAPEEHGKSAVLFARTVRGYLTSMRRALAVKNPTPGDCGIAFEHYTNAAVAAGFGASEGRGTGLYRQTKRVVRLRGFKGVELLKAAGKRFNRACVLTPRGRW